MINSNSGKNRHINIANYLKEMAEIQPYTRAVVVPISRDVNSGRITYSHLTFKQLDQESDCIAAGLNRAGIERGTKTILMVKPSLILFSLTFALFKTGAVPVMVDPGMGIKRMLSCLKQSNPEAFIGIPVAHALRTLFPKYFSSVKTFITIGKRWFWGGLTTKDIMKITKKPYALAETKEDETAAILFTTGSTGPAKGVVYTHKTFDSQIKQLRSHYNIKQGEIDLPTFPLFALFDPALGMTAIIPDMDPTKPAKVNPEKIVEAIINHGVTNMFASPALLDRVGKYGKNNNLKLPSLKRIISAGAPVSPKIIETFSSMLTEDARLHTPYGATEALPVSSIDSNEILMETKLLSEIGYGNCVGRVLGMTSLKLIKISDEPVEKFSHELLVPKGEIGEIIVSGDIVTKAYYKNETAQKLAKIEDDNKIWHRMGDLGWMDSNNRIWFCGRKNHRVITKDATLYTIPCESFFNQHPCIKRSALTGIGPKGDQTPVMCIELSKTIKKNRAILLRELQDIAKENEMTKDIKLFLFHKSFPVDIRHNSKIFREKLAIWAEKKIR